MPNVELGRTTADSIVRPEQGSIARVTAGGPAPGQVQKNYSGVQALSTSTTTVVLETVTTGRSYLITDIVITITGGTANQQTLCQLQFGGVNVFQSHINTTKGIEVLGIETGPIATSGQVVQLVLGINNTATVAYNIYGVEF